MRYMEAKGLVRVPITGLIAPGLTQNGQSAGINVPLQQEAGLSNRILSAVTVPELKRLQPYLEPVVLTRGQEISLIREFDDFVYFPESGVISHLYHLSDGGTTAAAVIGNDGIVGLSKIFEVRSPVYSTKVLIEGEGLRIRTHVVRNEFARAENFQREVLVYVNSRLGQISQRAVCNARHKVTERLCTWLLMINDRAEDRSLALTHADIASHLGARRTVISGCCHALRERGGIAYKRGHMIVADRELLERLACECYQVVRPQ